MQATGKPLFVQNYWWGGRPGGDLAYYLQNTIQAQRLPHRSHHGDRFDSVRLRGEISMRPIYEVERAVMRGEFIEKVILELASDLDISEATTISEMSESEQRELAQAIRLLPARSRRYLNPVERQKAVEAAKLASLRRKHKQEQLAHDKEIEEERLRINEEIRKSPYEAEKRMIESQYSALLANSFNRGRTQEQNAAEWDLATAKTMEAVREFAMKWGGRYEVHAKEKRIRIIRIA